VVNIAFFDLDRTLITVNSAVSWIRREVRGGNLSVSTAAKASAWIGLYHLGFSRLETVISDAVSHLKGVEEDKLRSETEVFWREEIRRCIRPGARDVLERHRDRGDQLVLLTSSSKFLAQAVGEDLGMDHVLSNRFEAENGRLTGSLHEPLCFGSGKTVYAQELAQNIGGELSRSTFYTDSYSDVSLMKAVANPVAVHPDLRLRRLARRNGWPVVDWS